MKITKFTKIVPVFILTLALVLGAVPSVKADASVNGKDFVVLKPGKGIKAKKVYGIKVILKLTEVWEDGSYLLTVSNNDKADEYLTKYGANALDLANAQVPGWEGTEEEHKTGDSVTLTLKGSSNIKKFKLECQMGSAKVKSYKFLDKKGKVLKAKK